MVGNGPQYANFGAKIFFIWGAFCVIAVFFVWCMVYESSKISLEQIDEMYERVNYAWNSKHFEPSWSFQQILDEGWSPSAPPPPEHELATTQSQTSADTTLGESVGTSSTIGNDAIDSSHSAEAPSIPGDPKGLPAMANVDFTY